VTEREQIAAALAEASRHTRARIGLSIDERASRDPREPARRCFAEWKLPEDDRPTAVLVYVSAPSRAYAIVGGQEVQKLAPPTFWDLVHRELSHHFEEGRYCDGIFKAIAQVALLLERSSRAKRRIHPETFPLLRNTRQGSRREQIRRNEPEGSAIRHGCNLPIATCPTC
jgi:uncharacterized membrane protein YgcG